MIGSLPGDPELPGVLAVGGLQLALGIADIVGVAKLPVARRQGLGRAVRSAPPVSPKPSADAA